MLLAFLLLIGFTTSMDLHAADYPAFTTAQRVITWNFIQNEFQEYRGSNITPEQSQVVWNSLSNQYRDTKTITTECSYRAHYWCYEMSKVNKPEVQNVRAYKLFLLYGAKYGSVNQDQWKYHVTPMVFVNGVPMVYDVLFMTRPLPIDTWKNEFISGHEDCAYLNKGQHWKANNKFNRLLSHGKEFCWYRVMPMYYFQPPAIKQYDDAASNPKKSFRMDDFLPYQLDLARTAFDFSLPNVPKPEIADDDDNTRADPQAHAYRNSRRR
ncbi:MAG: protein-glutamine glutaminase family protein [Pseudomonadota bacterium]